ncbi:acyl-CoA dehydrogenase family protein [Streptomyces atroolivaceus]|uniref:acyl-CoA dehydrogenase family protein n=1 Tax=Streptomyces atroolivaceus TaxID=66869 RepID=UPI0033FADFD1
MTDVLAPVETPTSLLDTIPTLEPVIRAGLDDLERGILPAEIMRAVEEAGILDVWIPSKVSGKEADPVDWLKAVEAIARIDASVGWAVIVLSGHVRLLTVDHYTRFSELTDGRVLPAFASAPRGRAVAVEGGYRVTGRWPFASGSTYATWHGGVATVVAEDGTPQMAPNGLHPMMIQVMWPADQGKIVETWDGLGLRGTASHDIEVEDLFVPDGQALLEPFPLRAEHATERVRELGVLAHGTHALGLARGALDEFQRIVASKPIPGSRTAAVMGHTESHRIAFAKADALLRAARSLLYGAVEDALVAAAHDELPMDHRVAVRQANIFAVRSCREVVDEIFKIAGTSAVYRGRVIERAFRDMSTAANHNLPLESSYESVGAYMLTKNSSEGPVSVGTPFF